MARRKSPNVSRHTGSKERDKQKHNEACTTEDKGTTKRRASANIVVSNDIRIKNKQAYRDAKDDLVVLATSKLLIPPKVRTIHLYDKYIEVKCYSIVMAAKALGKSVIQLRQWLTKGYIPRPALLVKGHGYFVYDESELQIIRKYLHRQTLKEVSYLTKNSIDFIYNLNEEIREYRGDTYGNTKKKKVI